MIARTWINSSLGLRVSRPGYDVRTATDQQIIFDSSRVLPFLYTKGVAEVAAATTFLQPFPETLPELPIAFVTRPVDALNVVQMGTGAFAINGASNPAYLDVHYQLVVSRSYFAILNRTTAAATFNIAIYRTD